MNKATAATTPTVSVILPTYNRAALLPRAIQSVLDQSFHDLELIVVDDCSTDTTETELLKCSDPRLRIIRQVTNSGPSAARNVGVRASAGRYIAFQDSDAEWFPQKLVHQINLLERRDANGQYPAACYSRYVLSRGRREIVIPSDEQNLLEGDIYSRLLYGNTMGTPTMVIRKEVLTEIGAFDESLRNLEDWDLALRLSQDHRIAFLDQVTMITYDSPGSVNKLVSPESQLIILRKHYESYARYPNAMANVTWQIGAAYASRCQRTEALAYFRLSLERLPTRARRLLFALMRAGIKPYQTAISARAMFGP